MKKIFAILALAFTASAFAADSVTLDVQNVNNLSTADSKVYVLAVKHDLTKNLVLDGQISNTQTDGTKALSTRIETGLTASTELFGPIKGYTRVSVGQKFSNGSDFSFYSIEPGVTAPVGPFTAKLGWRYRSATNTSNGDQTHTVRAALSYPLTKVDSIAVRYDRVTGDNDQKIWAMAYTRSF